ncbi:MAG: TRAP transporter large permease [Alphaproteobacteria bacterium]|nr:TRAP transporter large permease [Alphaproteobacteria bacterium]
MTLFLFVTFLLAMLIGVPVAVALGGSSMLYVIGAGTVPDLVVVHRMVSGVDSFPLLAVPFFIMAGSLMNTAGITERIYDFALALVGWLKGGLGHVNVVGSVIFAGMSGTAVADAGGLGNIEIKAMRDHGYDVEFAVGITGASSTIGPIIPPSLPMVIYGVMANTSIGQLFAAGFIPGLLMAATMMVMVAYYAHTRGFQRDMVFSWTTLGWAFGELVAVLLTGYIAYELWFDESLKSWPLWFRGPAPLVFLAGCALVPRFRAYLPLLTPVLLIGGMSTGAFTPTEAAIAAAVYAIFLGMVVYRTLTWRGLLRVSMETIETTTIILLIVAGASIFGWLITTSRVTDNIADIVLSITDTQWIVLLLVNLFLLIVGCFMETIAAITILVPVLLPLMTKIGVDPVHFGLIMVLNLMIGLLTPPVGMVLYILARVAKISFDRATRACAPFLVPLLVTLVLVTYIPSLSLWLPTMFYR